MQKVTGLNPVNANGGLAQLESETADDAPCHPSARRAVSFLFILLDCDRPWAGGARFTLAGTDEVIIGRGNENRYVRETANATRRLTLTLSSATLSSNHVRLLRVGDDWAIQDRSSRNGTWLNSRRIDYSELRDRDVFQLGGVPSNCWIISIT